MNLIIHFFWCCRKCQNKLKKMDQSTNNLTGALPLGSYAGSPAEGACELAIILKNAVQKDTRLCSAGQLTEAERCWSQLGNLMIPYCTVWCLHSLLKLNLFLPKTRAGIVQGPFRAMSWPVFFLSDDADTWSQGRVPGTKREGSAFP